MGEGAAGPIRVRSARGRYSDSLARWLSGAVLAGLLGSACSGADSEARTGGIREEASAADAVAEEGGDGPEQPVDSSDEMSPLGDGSGKSLAEGSGEAADGGFTPYEERVYPLGVFLSEVVSEVYDYPEYPEPMAAIEDLTHDCMVAQGFRYAKVDWAAKDAASAAAMPSLAEEDYMPTRGYGFADSLDAPEVIKTGYVNPNETIKAGLSTFELKAWEQRRRECVRQAQKEVMDRPGRLILRFALRDEMRLLSERIAADPRTAEATQRWSACMAEQGHHYAHPDEIFEYLASLADPLEARLRALGGPDNIDAAYQADLDALMAIEVEIAVADLACKRPLEQTGYEVTIDHEQRFLEENQDRLALLREELPTMTLPPPDVFLEWISE